MDESLFSITVKASSKNILENWRSASNRMSSEQISSICGYRSMKNDKRKYRIISIVNTLSAVKGRDCAGLCWTVRYFGPNYFVALDSVLTYSIKMVLMQALTYLLMKKHIDVYKINRRIPRF